jgi:hypothetical protein
MNEIVKRQDMLPSMDIGETLGKISPPQIPSLPYCTGLIGHMVHGWKVKKQAEFYKHEAEIASSQNAMVRDRLEVVMQLATFSDRVKLEFRKIEFESTMMNMREYEYQCEIRKKDAEAKEAEFSAKTAELDFKARLKAMKEEYGDDI